MTPSQVIQLFRKPVMSIYGNDINKLLKDIRKAWNEGEFTGEFRQFCCEVFPSQPKWPSKTERVNSVWNALYLVKIGESTKDDREIGEEHGWGTSSMSQIQNCTRHYFYSKLDSSEGKAGTVIPITDPQVAAFRNEKRMEYLEKQLLKKPDFSADEMLQYLHQEQFYPTAAEIKIVRRRLSSSFAHLEWMCEPAESLSREGGKVREQIDRIVPHSGPRLHSR